METKRPTTEPKLDTKELTLVKTALLYFTANADKWRWLASIVRGDKHLSPGGDASPPPSLRLIFYYVSTYAQDHRTLLPKSHVCPYTDASTTVSDSYKLMLRIHTKHRFDPFCRRHRRTFALHGIGVSTNVGQLVFFRWFFRNGVFDCLRRDLDAVRRVRSISRALRKKAKTTQRKRPSGGSRPDGRPSKPEEQTRVVVSFDNTQESSDIRIAVHFSG